MLYDLAHFMPDAHGGVFVLRFFLPERLFPGSPNSRAGYLRERKNAVYENLRDLNFEYKAGKLPDIDYMSLKSSLQNEAAALLAEIARAETSSKREGRNTRLRKEYKL
jgi:hypothetical protein